MNRWIVTTLAVGLALPLGGTAHRKTVEGNRQYGDGAYQEALRAYTEAQVAAPDAPQLHYDIGNVLYRQGDYQGAGEAYRHALRSAPPDLAPLALYNLGNALYRDGEFQDAVEAYRQALERRPGDADAKRNLELALRALKKKRPPQSSGTKNQKKQSKKEKEEKEKKSPSDSGKSGKNPRERSKKAAGSQPQGRGQPRAAPQAGRRTMSKEEAKRLLDALAQAERENMLKRARRRMPAGRKGTEEDW